VEECHFKPGLTSSYKLGPEALLLKLPLYPSQSEVMELEKQLLLRVRRLYLQAGDTTPYDLPLFTLTNCSVIRTVSRAALSERYIVALRCVWVFIGSRHYFLTSSRHCENNARLSSTLTPTYAGLFKHS
jgi:hypothetical protein